VVGAWFPPWQSNLGFLHHDRFTATFSRLGRKLSGDCRWRGADAPFTMQVNFGREPEAGLTI
ncbi:MAG: hypothetical protein WBD95_20360, partial [Xanthobacteraceae bacterium]